MSLLSKPPMKSLLSKLPMDVVYEILTYTPLIKKRNGVIVYQITKDDPRVNMLLEKYRRINKLDRSMENPKLVIRFLNENHYIRSSYANIAEKLPGYHTRYRACIRINVVKFERFKNGRIKEKGKFDYKYSHLIMDTT